MRRLRFNKPLSVRGNARRGAVAVLAAIMMMVVLAMVAFAVDLGYIAMAKTETQRTADAAAHAAVIEFARSGDAEEASRSAYSVTKEFSSANPVLGHAAAVAANTDVRVGRYEFGSDQDDLYYDNPDSYNAVKVRIRRTHEQNGAVPLFFARVMGHKEQAVESEAIAALIRNVTGVKSTGENVPMLPLVLSEKEWNKQIKQGGGKDEWAYDPATGQISKGSDNIKEVVLFPNKTGSSGNLGTVNIGTSNNGTSHLRDQIQNGLSPADMGYHGGQLALDGDGELELSGDPGLSSSIQSDLQAIAGQTRIMPLYRSVTGTGSNATFKIVNFVAVRIMSANLNGGGKGIIVQPGKVKFNGLIQGGSSSTKSEGIFSSPRIVD